MQHVGMELDVWFFPINDKKVARDQYASDQGRFNILRLIRGWHRYFILIRSCIALCGTYKGYK